MSTFGKALFVTAAATGLAAVALHQLDLEAAREELNRGAPGPGFDPDEMKEEDVAMLLNELASQL